MQTSPAPETPDTEAFDPYAMPAEAVQEPPVSLATAMLKIGPGIILAGSIVGSGELIQTTGLGAKFGFAFLWLILFSCVIKVFVQIELGRYAISSGKPTLAALNELPGPRLGAHWLVWWWFGMLMATVFQLGGMAGLVGQSMNLAFPGVSQGLAERLASVPALARAIDAHPERPWAILTGGAAVLLLLTGSYRRLELLTTFLVVSVTLVTVGCVVALPWTGYPLRWNEIGQGLTPWTMFAFATGIPDAFATFGITGVGASELYAYPYWCLEKGYARFAGRVSADASWVRRAQGWIRVMFLDAWASMVIFTLATVAFYWMGAAVLHPDPKLRPNGFKVIETLSEMYTPAFGSWARAAFLVGAWAVLFKTLYVASAGHARLTTDFLGLGGWIKSPSLEDRQRWIRRWCVFYPSLAVVLYLALGDPKLLVFIGGFGQGVTLPVICGATLYLRYKRTDPRLAPSKAWDAMLWLAVILICAGAAYAVPTSLYQLWQVMFPSPPAVTQ